MARDLTDQQSSTAPDPSSLPGLIATQAFGTYAAGDRITDAAAIAAILASDQAAFVVRVAGAE